MMKQSALLLFLSLASTQVVKILGVVDGGCLADKTCTSTFNCCSSAGFCGTSDDYCGTGCQGGPCTGGGNYNYCGASWDNAGCGVSCYDGTNEPCPSGETCFADIITCPIVAGPNGTPQPTNNPVVPPTGNPPTENPPTGNTVAGGDSRVIAYVGNWQTCPTAAQLDGYTHLVVAFAVSYVYQDPQNQCNTQCDIGTSVPICAGATASTVSDWKNLGKKVILSMGGAGMGGSWAGNVNNCWDYCFGKEGPLSTALVSMVQNQGFDGVDLDYEYCYDVDRDKHDRNCHTQSATGLYTDLKATTFLTDMTMMLRKKLDALGPDYELTHAPMDSDLVPSSEYYQILKAHNEKLNFLMPQFYNGITKAVPDGFDGSGMGATSASVVYNNIANDIFPGQPEKVVFGFCISDCSAQGSNTDGAEAVEILRDIKAYNGAEFNCNGGAFVWIASDDTGGGWSDQVYAEVSKTSGCSDSGTSSPTSTPSKAPSCGPTSSPTGSPILEFSGTCSDNSEPCLLSDLNNCACSANRRNLLKGGESKKLRGKHNLRKLIKKAPSTLQPTVAATPNPTASPIPPTSPPTAPPTSFECMCILSTTPSPTNPPTQPDTPSPTSSPIPLSNCDCTEFTQKNTCQDGCQATCSWSGRNKKCS